MTGSHNQPEICHYLVVKGDLASEVCVVYGLLVDDEKKLSEKFTITSDDWTLDGRNLKGTLTKITNTLAELGYRYVTHLAEREFLLERKLPVAAAH